MPLGGDVEFAAYQDAHGWPAHSTCTGKHHAYERYGYFEFVDPGMPFHKHWCGLEVGEFIEVIKRHGGVTALCPRLWDIARNEGLAGVVQRLRVIMTRRRLSKLPGSSIAVVVHAFYPDVFDTLVPYLKNLPRRFDLYVSVSDKRARKHILRQLRPLAQVDKRVVTVVPNRGRDIAPLLVTFADAAMQHDYILHLHTKKSLYTGGENTAWRDYLFMELAGSPERIRDIFDQFVCHPDTGIVYPETFGGLPYWAHAWLQNERHARELAGRLGIDIDFGQYVDAPMGSMFWARSAALKPLFDLKLTFDSFPEECGQTDGTLQHAIERLFVPVVGLAGYRYNVMGSTQSDTTLFCCPGGKNLHQYYAASVADRIVESSAAADIVSFDIFDTLLVWPWFSPDQLLHFLSRDVERRYGIADFYTKRKQAEDHAGAQTDGSDVGLTQIYAAFATITGCDAEQTDALMALETQCATEMLTLNTEIADAAHRLHEQGKHLVLVSDMYLSSDFIRRVLRNHGIDIFDRVYISCEQRVRKDTGQMWEWLPRSEGIPKNRWLHVGDNEHSDIQRPTDLGFLHPIHAMRAAVQFRLFNEGISNWPADEHWPSGLVLGLLARRLFVQGHAHTTIDKTFPEKRISINSARDFGYLLMGPLLGVFMAWLTNRAARDGVEQLLYASREGYLLLQAHELITRKLGDGWLPQGDYFLCSRVATSVATLDQGVPASLLEGTFTGSFEQLLAQRFDVDDTTVVKARLGRAAMQQDAHLPRDKPSVKARLEQSRDLLAGQARERQHRYVRYIKDTIGAQSAALVDIGYSGTIQKALATLTDRLVGGYYLANTSSMRELESRGQFARGCFDHQVDRAHTRAPIFHFNLMLEAVLTAPHGQFLGIDSQGEPQYKAAGQAQLYFKDVHEMHRGALEYLDQVIDITGTNFEWMSEATEAAQLPLTQFIHKRWQLGFDTSALYVEDQFSGNDEVIAEPFSARATV